MIGQVCHSVQATVRCSQERPGTLEQRHGSACKLKWSSGSGLRVPLSHWGRRRAAWGWSLMSEAVHCGMFEDMPRLSRAAGPPVTLLPALSVEICMPLPLQIATADFVCNFSRCGLQGGHRGPPQWSTAGILAWIPLQGQSNTAPTL